MTDKEPRIKYDKICSNLAERRLKPAFDLLDELISDNEPGIFNDECRNLEETYHYMLKYTLEGIRDPERKKVYRRLIVSVFELADKVNESVRHRLSTSAEYEKKRFFRTSFITNLSTCLKETEDFFLRDEVPYSSDNNSSRPKDAATSETSYDQAAKENQQMMQRLFYHIWFRDKLTSEEIKPLRKFLTSPVIPAHNKAFMTTALMLSLQRYFDTEKFILLFDAFGSKEAVINQRALVGLLINLYKYDARMPFYPEITGRLKILNENPEFKSNLERIIVQFIRSKETEKLQQRIRDEILPEMIKISPNLKNKINLDSLMEEGYSEDKNPEWEEILKDSPGLLNKMEEFSEMQMKGADVFMGSFSMLKSFPFFSEMSNWFMPFFPENPEIIEILDVNDQTVRHLVEAIEHAPILCNSDKYSFCLSIQKLPKENLEFMTQAMKAEMEQVKEISEDEELLDPGRKAEFISNQYIQDLYRFYKLFPRKNDFEDIFSWRFDFHNKLAIGDILKEDPKVLRNISEYYFARDHYEEAAGIFEYLLEQDKNGELYQKIAWCNQKTGDFKKALDNYLKAELYEVNRLWNTKKIALCYRNLRQPDKALEYYKEAEKIDPENLGNQLNIGHCLLELDRYEEALKCYFKVEYLAPGNKKVWRPIAWCSFLTGKKEQAGKYLLKLIEDEPNKHDYINMGHVEWSLGNRKSALDYYRRSIRKAGGAEVGDSHKKDSDRESPGSHTAAGSGPGERPGARYEPKGKAAKKSAPAAGATDEGFTEGEFLEVFEEDRPHLIRQGIDSEDVPIMLDQLRYYLEE